MPTNHDLSIYFVKNTIVNSVFRLPESSYTGWYRTGGNFPEGLLYKISLRDNDWSEGYQVLEVSGRVPEKSFSVVFDTNNLFGTTMGKLHVTVIVEPQITLQPSKLPSAIEGLGYSTTILTTNGTAPFTYKKWTDAPEGLTIDAGTGTVKWPKPIAGSYNFYLGVTDSKGYGGHDNGENGWVKYTLLVEKVHKINLPYGFIGAGYNLNFRDFLHKNKYYVDDYNLQVIRCDNNVISEHIQKIITTPPPSSKNVYEIVDEFSNELNNTFMDKTEVVLSFDKLSIAGEFNILIKTWHHGDKNNSGFTSEASYFYEFKLFIVEPLWGGDITIENESIYIDSLVNESIVKMVTTNIVPYRDDIDFANDNMSEQIEAHSFIYGPTFCPLFKTMAWKFTGAATYGGLYSFKIRIRYINNQSIKITKGVPSSYIYSKNILFRVRGNLFVGLAANNTGDNTVIHDNTITSPTVGYREWRIVTSGNSSKTYKLDVEDKRIAEFVKIKYTHLNDGSTIAYVFISDVPYVDVFNFSVIVIDELGNIGIAKCKLKTTGAKEDYTIHPKPPLPNAFIGLPYPTKFSVPGVSESLSFSILEGKLPSELTLVENTGKFNGVVTQGPGVGAFAVRVQSLDGMHSGTQYYSLHTIPPDIRELTFFIGDTFSVDLNLAKELTSWNLIDILCEPDSKYISGLKIDLSASTLLGTPKKPLRDGILQFTIGNGISSEGWHDTIILNYKIRIIDKKMVIWPLQLPSIVSGHEYNIPVFMPNSIGFVDVCIENADRVKKDIGLYYNSISKTFSGVAFTNKTQIYKFNVLANDENKDEGSAAYSVIIYSHPKAKDLKINAPKLHYIEIDLAKNIDNYEGDDKINRAYLVHQSGDTPLGMLDENATNIHKIDTTAWDITVKETKIHFLAKSTVTIGSVFHIHFVLVNGYNKESSPALLSIKIV